MSGRMEKTFLRIDQIQVIRNQLPARFTTSTYVSATEHRIVVLWIWRNVFYIRLWRVTTTSKGE
jgi:hypothetical protein